MRVKVQVTRYTKVPRWTRLGHENLHLSNTLPNHLDLVNALCSPRCYKYFILGSALKNLSLLLVMYPCKCWELGQILHSADVHLRWSKQLCKYSPQLWISWLGFYLNSPSQQGTWTWIGLGSILYTLGFIICTAVPKLGWTSSNTLYLVSWCFWDTFCIGLVVAKKNYAGELKSHSEILSYT